MVQFPIGIPAQTVNVVRRLVRPEPEAAVTATANYSRGASAAGRRPGSTANTIGVVKAGSFPASERREALMDVLTRARGCVRCAELAATRHSVVFGAGNADADLMFVGEAPGAREDELGLPFVGRAGKLLEQLLREIGLERADVFIANVLKCRPPSNRDPLPAEITNCSEYLMAQVELIAPRVICTLGNFATKLLRCDTAGITRVHGRAEVRQIGPRTVRLYPIYHPAAALYTPRMLEVLREDFAGLPALLAQAAPAQPLGEPTGPDLAASEQDDLGAQGPDGPMPAAGLTRPDAPRPPGADSEPAAPAPEPGQMDLF